jgi:hypothetical protein
VVSTQHPTGEIFIAPTRVDEARDSPLDRRDGQLPHAGHALRFQGAAPGRPARRAGSGAARAPFLGRSEESSPLPWLGPRAPPAAYWAGPRTFRVSVGPDRARCRPPGSGAPVRWRKLAGERGVYWRRTGTRTALRTSGASTAPSVRGVVDPTGGADATRLSPSLAEQIGGSWDQLLLSCGRAPWVKASSGGSLGAVTR